VATSGPATNIGGSARLAASAVAVSPVARPVLLYSDSCRFCRWAARTIAALDRHQQLALLPLAHEAAALLLDAVPANRRAESWWVVRRDGVPVSGTSGGGIVLLAEISRTRFVGRVLGEIGLSSLIDVLGALVARHRGRLSRFVPDGPAPQRYP
jgi:predicted DCC family thiol-disulfide oxidoreductase YuxK